ncbi:hypothetical protein PAGA_a2053 [Pseudoalteromonas agarivorans DSM 14585]|uniref:Uncharacterized protein n=1 Tax=Pseudoalteromonas agarivorans DSM 14585 TaxID=1312369 RepID=A0ACA8DW20_9GAMM|nr:hypothetical protein PAGA_a2053 [Pseudoalteromonas agarivorans DSM 14585]
MGYNAKQPTCSVPANEVSDLIFLLCVNIQNNLAITNTDITKACRDEKT